MDVYALLYDRILKPKGPVKIGFQTGFAFSLSVDQGDKGFMGFFPIKGYLLMGKTKHFLETGLGLKISGIPYPDFNIGYRYKSVDKGFSFRIGYAGLAFFNGFNSMFGASAGYAF